MRRPADRRKGFRVLFGLAKCISALVVFSLLAGCGGQDQTASAPSVTTTSTTAPPLVGPKVVVSNTWVGSFAKIAGATNIAVLVPQGEKDPNAYVLTDKERAVAADAAFIFVGEDDPIAKQLGEPA